jgi:hypothetical protein
LIAHRYQPNGSSINVGSFVLADPGPDFGESDLLKAAYSESPAVEGAVLAFESVNHRTMTFPVRIASVGTLGGAAGAQSWFRTLARPGATLDVTLDGVPSSEAIRWDVLSGRLELAQWDTRQYAQADRMEATLKLDTQPFGFWPTLILIASSASVGLPGTLALPAAGGGSFIGDIAGQAELAIVATTSATSYPAGSWRTDMVGWSLSARPSFTAHLRSASLISNFGNASLIGDKFSVSSQALRAWTTGSQAATSWQSLALFTLAPELEPAYRGLHRIFAWMSLSPSIAQPVFVSADVTPNSFAGALASAAPIATLAPQVASGTPGAWGAQASPAYTLLDLGELAIPKAGSGAPQGNLNIRLWYGQGTNNIGLGPGASVQLTCAGIYLQPLSMAGVVPRGLVAPTISAPVGFEQAIELDSTTGRAIFGFATTASAAVISEMGAYYRGLLPMVGASTIALDLLGGGRKAFASSNDPLVNSAPHAAAVALRYRPRFVFIKGI